MGRGTSIAIACLALGAALAAPAGAQDYRRWQYAPRVECETSGDGVRLTFEWQPVEWSAPAGAQFRLIYAENDAVTEDDGPFPVESTSGSQVYAAFGAFGDAYPFSASVRIDTLVDGEVTYRSELHGECAYDGPGTSTLSETVTWFRRWAFAPSGTCSTLGDTVRIQLASQPVEWVLPNDAQFTIGYVENGVLDVDGPIAAEGVGEGSMTYGAFANTFDSYPFTFDFRLDTIVGGEIVYRSTLSASCAADGPTPVTLLNEAPEPGGATLASAALAALAALARRERRA